MGKVHRIKRDFAKLVAGNPWQGLKPGESKYYPLAKKGRGRFGETEVSVGVRYDGSKYIVHCQQSYAPLMEHLTKGYYDVGRDSS